MTTITGPATIATNTGFHVDVDIQLLGRPLRGGRTDWKAIATFPRDRHADALAIYAAKTVTLTLPGHRRLGAVRFDASPDLTALCFHVQGDVEEQPAPVA